MRFLELTMPPARFALLLAPLAAACIADPGAPRTGAGSGAVINGEVAQDGQFPATGALVVDYDGDFQPTCTGTLIAENVVLTAAHCVDDVFLDGEVPGFTLVIDANAVTAADVYPGASKHKHPQFDLFNTPEPGVGIWYDIGLLILAEPVTGVTPELLPTPEQADATLQVDAQVDLVGYGYTDQEAGEFGVKAVGRASLVEVGSHEIWIAKPGEQQNCNGDSGGPAYLEPEGGGRRIFGVVSRSPDDNATCDHGGIDTRVDPYLPWIEEVLAGSDAGLPGPPDAAPPPPDAAAEPDAGSDAGIGAGGDGDEGGGGCGCRTGGPGGAASSGLLVLLCAGIAQRMRDRRRRRRAPAGA
ncbi:MAG TPA: trypsin-like serine protease [Kofleriaceae bacterium]|nr:trypsin-like serine protease [Kofleriaceae bacterium]